MKSTFVFSLLTFLLLFSLLAWISKTLSPVYPLQTERYQRLYAQKDSIKAITLGNSHSYAIDFQTLGMRGFHLWQPMEDLFETHFKAENIIPHLQNLEIVFIPIAPFLLYFDSHLSNTQQFKNRVKLHYQFGGWRWIRNDIGSWLRGRLADVVRYDHWAFLPKRIFLNDTTPAFEDPTEEYLGRDGNIRGRMPSVLSAAELTKHGKRASKEHQQYMSTCLRKDDNIQTATLNTLKQLIRFLKKHNVKVVLFIAPHYKGYCEAWEAKGYLVSLQSVSTLANEERIVYWNAYRFFEISPEATYFYDSHHLNYKGSVAFSKKLKMFITSENQ